VVSVERRFTVEFGPSRSKRFGRAVAQAQRGADECSDRVPGRYRATFLLAGFVGAIMLTAFAEDEGQAEAAAGCSESPRRSSVTAGQSHPPKRWSAPTRKHPSRSSTTSSSTATS
jgi:hypothetical protein